MSGPAGNTPGGDWGGSDEMDTPQACQNVLLEARLPAAQNSLWILYFRFVKAEAITSNNIFILYTLSCIVAAFRLLRNQALSFYYCVLVQ